MNFFTKTLLFSLCAMAATTSLAAEPSNEEFAKHLESWLTHHEKDLADKEWYLKRDIALQAAGFTALTIAGHPEFGLIAGIINRPIASAVAGGVGILTGTLARKIWGRQSGPMMTLILATACFSTLYFNIRDRCNRIKTINKLAEFIKTRKQEITDLRAGKPAKKEYALHC